MVPLIFNTEVEYSSRAFMSFGPTFRDFIWVSDANAFTDGKDISQSPPGALKIMVRRLERALEEAFGVDAKNHARVIPLIECEEGQPDLLRAVMVSIPDKRSIEDTDFQEFAEAFARRLKAVTGHECAAVSEMPEFSSENAALVSWFQIQGQPRRTDFEVRDPCVIPAAAPPKVLTSGRTARVTPEAAMAGALDALVEGEPLTVWAMQQEETRSRAPQF